jgi:iron(III) transport system permease protein
VADGADGPHQHCARRDAGLADGTYALAGRQLWSALAVAPLAIPAFVQSYAWVSAVPSLHGLSAGVFLSVLAYYPFIYMPVAAVLRRLDPTLEDVAASLGTPPWKVFFRVVLPQLRLAICGGALLVACICWRNMACM